MSRSPSPYDGGFRELPVFTSTYPPPVAPHATFLPRPFVEGLPNAANVPLNSAVAGVNALFPLVGASEARSTSPYSFQARDSQDGESANVISGAKVTTRWSDEQTLVLVQEWKERVHEVESSKSVEAWNKIVAAVNKAGPEKTVKQCKDKIRNLKQAYKDAKTNNSKTGRGNKSSPFFTIFDEVLGSRPVVKMPGVMQSTCNSESPSTSASATDVTSESDDDHDASFPPNSEINKRKNVAKPALSKKKARKKESSENNLMEVIAEMQNTQVKAMEACQRRSEELMLKLELEQRKLDEDSKRRDQEFFLRMAELLKK